MNSVRDYVKFSPNQLESKVPQVCYGLIMGVSLTGKSSPTISLSARDFYVKMIHFNLAMQVKNEDEKVTDQCRTERWMAPDVERRRVWCTA